ncbi:MAG: polysaccharide deacetylase [Sphingobacteriales bacterium]|nr:polysaccharide deacetylase [Sphingobacteriales bacterium]
MVLLSFDIEEFDMPFEYGKNIDFDDQIKISKAGTIIILDLLKKHSVSATFFCTATFAKNAPDLIERMIIENHEVASHGYYHSDFEVAHLVESKRVLEDISHSNVIGFRMARMMPVDEHEVSKAGYIYNTSINPTFLPGRYNNFSLPRTFFKQKGVIQIPASVTPLIRIPLFWLAFHNFPLFIYKQLCKWTYNRDNYLNLYFHPWEFTDLDNKQRFGFPLYVTKNCGTQMHDRMDIFIKWLKLNCYTFGTFKDFLKTI